jgi:N-acetylglucosamine kinase-like BadF-type ATPase
MKLLILIVMPLFSLNIAADTQYTLCIDGGGSKTLLQIINQEGTILKSIKAPGSNINKIGKDGVRRTFQLLFDNIQDLQSILPHCHIIAGLAGCGLAENKATVISLFAEWGIKKEDITVFSDAELALNLIKDNGAILIAGTGSISIGKNNNILYRVGGLGRILGDEGSGYYIGREALKASLAEECGWGIPTTLTQALRTLFHVDTLKSLIPHIESVELSPATIASITSLVFEQCNNDAVASAIINHAAEELATLVTTLVNNAQLNNAELHLWGGLFKSSHAAIIINKIIQRAQLQERNIVVINQAEYNPAVLYARIMQEK